MATMTSCILNESTINIQEAIDIRDSSNVRPDFRCVECKMPVRAHKSGGHAVEHFEHLERNLDCSLSHKPR